MEISLHKGYDFTMNESDVRRFMVKVDDSGGPDACHWWTAAIRAKSRQYGVFWMDGAMHSAHRIAWAIEHGSILTSEVVLRHTCDQTRCVNPRHLAPGTPADNMHDRIDHGKGYPHGEAHPLAKLTAGDIEQARKFREQGVYWREIARRIGVAQCTIERAVRGETWSHLRNGAVQSHREG